VDLDHYEPLTEVIIFFFRHVERWARYFYFWRKSRSWAL